MVKHLLTLREINKNAVDHYFILYNGKERHYKDINIMPYWQHVLEPPPFETLKTSSTNLHGNAVTLSDMAMGISQLQIIKPCWAVGYSFKKVLRCRISFGFGDWVYLTSIGINRFSFSMT